MRPHTPIFVLVNLIVFVQLGCARTAEERQLDSMRAEIDQIQEERDSTEAPAASPETARSPSLAASATASNTTPPQTAGEVVRVGTPDDAVADDYADPDDTTPRPNIRVSGGGVRGGRRGDEQADFQRVDDDPSTRAGAFDPDAKRAYDAALSLVNAKQYDKGLEGLAAFLVKWPDHPYADHAMFWRGECYFAEGAYARASDEFQGMLARFPASVKAPDALLKLGICHQKLGQLSQAKECFDRLTQEYPQADAARHVPSIPVPAAAPSAPASEDHR